MYLKYHQPAGPSGTRGSAPSAGQAATESPRPALPTCSANRLRQTMQLFCLLLTLLAAAPLWAGEFYLNGLGFGDRPTADMVCSGGACLPPGQRPARALMASYILPMDWTRFGSTPITPPRYDFLDSRLFRIRFRLDCRPDQGAACPERFWQEFTGQHAVTETSCPVAATWGEGFACRRGVLTDGEVVSLAWPTRGGGETLPRVQVYDPYLMDEARQQANPTYLPGD